MCRGGKADDRTIPDGAMIFDRELNKHGEYLLLPIVLAVQPIL